MNKTNFKRIKLYIVFAILLYGVYAWAGVTGYRILGDDIDSKETASGPGTHGASGFYHK